MKEHFDLIALPRGQHPSGPVQASNGEWFLVIPARLDLSNALRTIEQMRSGRPVRPEERQAALLSLSEQAAE